MKTRKELEEKWEDVMNGNTKRNLMDELKEGIEALAESRKLPQSAYILPDEKTAYIAVWLTPSSLVIRLLQTKEKLDVKLDKKILPHLVDALIDLQNQK